jgi:hypothetical protein
MSTSLLYHAFGVRGYVYVRSTRFVGDAWSSRSVRGLTHGAVACAGRIG